MLDLRRLKIILSILVIILTLTSVGLLLAGYLKKHPINFRSDIAKSEYEETKYVEAAEVSGVYSENTQNGSSINLNFDSIFTPQLSTDKVYLVITTFDSKLVGYLDTSERFNLLFELPNNASQISLYGENAVAYTLVDEKYGGVELYIKDKSSTEKLVSFGTGNSIDSFKYVPAKNIFYILTSTEDSKFEVFLVSIPGTANSVFSTYGNQYDNSKLEFVKDDSLYFCNKTQSCNVLDLYSKSIKSETSLSIIRNNLSFILKANADGTYTYYNQVNAVEVNLNKTEEHIDRFYLQPENLFFVELNKDNINETFIESFNFGNKTKQKKITVPTSLLTSEYKKEMFALKDAYYLISLNKIEKIIQKQSSMQGTKNVGEQIQTLDIINPGSETTSGSTATTNLEYTLEGLNLNIQNIYKIEILQQEFLI